MIVHVKLFATLRYGRFAVGEIEFPEGTTVAQVLTQINIPAGEVAIILINGRSSDVETVLRDSDTLALFPPVGGG